MKNKKRIIPILIIVSLLNIRFICADVSDRIEGVADFLIERANETAICMFEDKLNQNPLLKEYFPNTTKILSTFNLKILMLNSTLWQYNVEKDLNSLAELLRNNLKEQGVKLLSEDDYGEIRSLQNILEKKLKNQDSIDKFNSFYKLTQENLKAISLDALADKESLQLSQWFIDDLLKKLNELEQTLNKSTDKFATEANTKIKSLKKDLTNIKNSLEHVDYILNDKLTYTERVSHIFIMIESIDSLRQIFSKNPIVYRKFKNYSLFFTQMSDAKSSNDAKVILKTFALPASSYRSKRKGEMRLSVSSYLGLTAGRENSQDYSGLVAPIGIEYDYSINEKWSIGVLGNIFDFGTVVNSQIYDTSETFGFKDIVAPGLALVVGLPEVPVSIGAGYFSVHGLQSNTKSERVLLFIGFDMPLFSLY